jgi:HTH-type transcriptional regulator/antitoxin HigA
MNILPIKNVADYEATLERINQLMDAARDTPEGDELEVLALMVDAYEDTHYPIADPDPIEFLKYVMECQGYEQKDLACLLNSRPRASEILNRQRPLNLTMIRLISQAWQVPVEPLIREYSLSVFIRQVRRD